MRRNPAQLTRSCAIIALQRLMTLSAAAGGGGGEKLRPLPGRFLLKIDSDGLQANLLWDGNGGRLDEWISRKRFQELGGFCVEWIYRR